MISDQTIPGFQSLVDWRVTMWNQFWMSSGASHEIGLIDLSVSTNYGVYLDGAAATAGGGNMETGQPVSPAAGGQSGEVWGGFSGVSVNESGSFAVTAYTVIFPLTVQRVQVIDGLIQYREGDVLDGVTLGDANGLLKMNDDGDRLYQWELADANQSGALFLNDDLLVAADDPVDLDGDGFADEDVTVRKIVTFTKMDLSGRDPNGHVQVYAALQLDKAGQRVDTLVHIDANAGDLRLVARPSLAAAGDSVTVRLRGGLPSSPAVPVVISVNGLPTWLKLPSITLDASGAAELTGVVPPGLGSLDLELVSIGVTPAGKVRLSNVTPLSLG